MSTRSTGPQRRRKILVVKQSHALAALIDDVRAANGWSDPDVVARAASKGHKLSKSNISRIRNNPVVTLNIETVSALADGLGISKAMVAQAALASMGIVTYNSSDLTSEEAIRRDPTLGQRDKQMLLTVLAGLRGVADATEQGGGLHQSHPEERDARNRLMHDEPAEGSRGGKRRHPVAEQKTESVPDHLPVQFGGSTAAQVSIVITELRKRYGSENGRLPEDWRESIIESGLWEDAAAPFLTGQLGRRLLKEQLLNRLIDQLEKTAANNDLAEAKRLTAENIEKIKANTQRADEYPDNDIPLPEDYLELAAHPDVESSGRREHEAGRERGEESQ